MSASKVCAHIELTGADDSVLCVEPRLARHRADAVCAAVEGICAVRLALPLRRRVYALRRDVDCGTCHPRTGNLLMMSLPLDRCAGRRISPFCMARLLAIPCRQWRALRIYTAWRCTMPRIGSILGPACRIVAPRRCISGYITSGSMRRGWSCRFVSLSSPWFLLTDRFAA